MCRMFFSEYAYLVVLVFFLSLFSGCSSAPPEFQDPLTPEERAWVEAHDSTFVLCYDKYRPPLEFQDKNGEYQGITSDYMRLIEERLRIRFRYQTYEEWGDVFKKEEILDEEGKRIVDIVSSAQPTEPRRKFFNFTSTYMRHPIVIIARKEKRGELTLEDLKGRRVAVTGGYTIRRYLERDYPSIILVPVGSEYEALHQTSFGEVDAMVSALETASYCLEESTIANLRLAGETGYAYTVAIGIRNDWPELLPIMEKGLSLISPDERREIDQRWVTLSQGMHLLKKRMFYGLLFLVAGCVLLLLVIILWTYNLRRLVRLRTEELHVELEKQVKAEAKAKERERHLTTLLGNLPGVAYRCSNDGSWSMDLISERCKELTGYDEEKFLTHKITWSDLVYPDDWQVVYDAVQKALEEHSFYQLEYRIITAEREEKWVWEKGCGVYGEQENILALEGFISEITDRKRAEEERLQLSSIIEQTADMMIVADTEGIVQYVNPAYIRITGYAKEELLGKHVTKILELDKQSELYLSIREKIKNGENWEGQITTHRKKDSSFASRMTISPIRDSSGKITAFVSVQHDISHELELETKLRHAQKMEAMGTLAGGIAHDFNNILSGIMGFTDLANDLVQPGTEIHEYLSQIYQAGKRASGLVSQILTFSRQKENEIQPLKLSPIIKEAVKLLRGSIPPTIEIRQRISENCGAIMADPSQVHQVIMNLCTNAYHAMKETGGIIEISMGEVDIDRLRANRHVDLSEGRYVRLAVSDTGAGIPHAVLDRIFEPYFTTKKPGEGTGLGLATVHGIVTSCGGAIHAYSEVGHGATFTLFFPLCEDEIQGESPSQLLPISELMGSERILFVDDEQAIIRFVSTGLSRLGYNLTTCSNSLTALEIFEKNPNDFDILVTDQMMPGLRGVELAQAIRKIRPEIDVVLCSGFSDIHANEVTNRIGEYTFVKKPIITRELAQIIRNTMDGKRQATP